MGPERKVLDPWFLCWVRGFVVGFGWRSRGEGNGGVLKDSSEGR